MLSRTQVSPRVYAALLSTLALLALLGASAAQAVVTHVYTGTSFGPGGVGSGSFEEVVSISVQQSSEDVFVLDWVQGTGRLFKFNASGEPIDFSNTGTNVIEGVGSGFANSEEIAVDESNGPDAGDIYVANGSIVRIYAASGAFLGELSNGQICGVAVDSSGNVYVGVKNEGGVVRRYAPSTAPVTSADETGSIEGLGEICNVAVDSAGNVYTAAPFGGGVTRYDPLQFGSLAPSGEPVDSQGKTLAVDVTSGEVFVSEGSEVAQYEGSGQPPKLISRFNGFEGDASGVGIEDASGDVLGAQRDATGNGEVVEIFGPTVTLPDVSTEAAANVGLTEATLHGTVEPSGTEVTSCLFRYGVEAERNHSAPCEPATPYTGSAPVAVAAHITGLSTGTRYGYEVIASNASGQTIGEYSFFRTRGPGVSDQPARSLLSTKAVASAQIYPGGEVTTYHLEYGTSTAYGSSSGDVELEAGEEPVNVEVPIEDLQPDTTYHYRFAVSTPAATATGADVEFTTPAVITNETLTSVGTDSAGMSADIAPGGRPTTYELEYGTSNAYGSSTPPISVGSGEAPVPVISRISELQPGATYHFRFVAIKENASVVGPDIQFTTHTLSAAGLPDGRGYEMVTPVDDEGAEPYVSNYAGVTEADDAIFTGFPMAAAADGNAVVYVGSPTSSGSGSEGNGLGNQFYAHRNPDGGWTQTDIQPEGYKSPTYIAFSSDLGQAVLSSSEPLTAEAPPQYDDLYIRDDATGSYEPLSTVTPPDRSPGEFGTDQYAGASADFRQLFFEASDELASGAIDPGFETNNLYEAVDGQLHTVNVLPNGAPAPNAAFGAQVGLHPESANFGHAISADGSRVFWTDLKTGSLYVREGGERTKLIAEDATFETASADGSKVLYSKAGDLYEENLESQVTRDLAPGAETLGLAGAGEDLEYVYLVGRGTLQAGAIAGKSNLYLLHGGQIQLIAVLGSEEYASRGKPWEGEVGLRAAEATPSGHDLVFSSEQSLTGYENTKAAEVYVYDADSGRLTCVSCDPSGAPPVAGETAGLLPLSGYPTYQLRWISEDGSRVFFQSAQPLLPQAQNGKMNVYEWERDGSGSCAYADGCIYLLSTGTSPQGSFLIDASASGNDVFIETTSQLLSADQNEYFDIYDARVGAREGALPVQCTGTGCQGVAASPPIFATPASATYEGVGNFSPAATPVAKPKPKSKTRASCTKNRKKTKRSKAKKSAKQAKTKASPKPAACKAKKAAAKRVRRGTNGRGGR